MIGWTNRNNKKTNSKPCPCKKLCPCHNPHKEPWWIWLFPPFILLSLIIFILLTTPENKTQYIEVNGNMCEIHYKETGHTSTGNSLGHNIAICK